MRHRRRDAGVPVGQRAPQTYRIITFVVGYFELESGLLTEGNILDPSYEIGVTSLVIIGGAVTPSYRVAGKTPTDLVGHNSHFFFLHLTDCKCRY